VRARTAGRQVFSGVLLWGDMRRFFAKAVKVVEADNEVLAETQRRALPNWPRHIRATHAIARGAELTTRGYLHHGSIAMTSIYPYCDGMKRVRCRDTFR